MGPKDFRTPTQPLHDISHIGHPCPKHVCVAEHVLMCTENVYLVRKVHDMCACIAEILLCVCVCACVKLKSVPSPSTEPEVSGKPEVVDGVL